MNGAKSVSASFNTNPLVRIVVGETISYFGLILDAYAAAANGNTIQVRDMDFTENLLFDKPISVTVKGGYGSNYLANSGTTKVHGKLTISRGTVTIEKLTIH